LDHYCDAWHSSSTQKVGMASNLMHNRLLEQQPYACNNRFVVLCVEVVQSRRRRRRSVEELRDDLTADEYQLVLDRLQTEG